MRSGGSWKRGYGSAYTGTKGETPETDKADPSGLPRQLSTLPRALNDYLVHYHAERNHQGKGNVLLFPTATQAKNHVDGSVRCKERLGRLLKYYHREAA